jgi:hypothetical protein
MVPPNRPDATIPATSPGAKSSINPTEVSRKLKQEYAHGSKDPSMRGLDSLNSLIKTLSRDSIDLDDMLEQTTRMIYSQFAIKEVSIGLKTPPDWLFRYVKMHGMRAEVWEAHKGLVYTHDELFDPKKYKHTVISPLTRLFLAEDNPYMEDEAYTYSAHLSAMSKRRALDDSIEGDYLDVYITGADGEILGWIETGSTWDGKIPSARTIKCLEMIGTILGIAITRYYASTGQKMA